MDRVYACSGIFIAHLRGNEHHSLACTNILDAARDGLVELHTSYFTVAEVLAKEPPLARRTREDQQTIKKLMDSDFINYSAVEMLVSEIARNVSWEFQVKPPDAIHIATAIQRKCSVFYTTDVPLLARSGSHNDRITLPEIRLPEFLIQQPILPF